MLVNAARTFRSLSDAEAAALRPYRLRVVPTAGTTAAQLAQRLPYTDYKMERLLLLNGVDSAAELVRLPQVKTIEPSVRSCSSMAPAGSSATTAGRPRVTVSTRP